MNVKKGSLQSQNPHKGKDYFYQKGPAKGSLETLLNSENSQVFSFSISTNVLGVDSRSPPAGEIY
ncbi:hypothetical protein ASJ81_06245 [Methanosarcina spelaei]|uniref:Uncharacterized protein n=1 Tax=Methanosarcina spelaei TaxID=1036679 RepID=A0A2A2HT61_9EURY|nr:hypothetical protein ASJ81_06245 [Methanosarcina spelaei]